ncbi:MAG: phosphatase PAP2 family protein [Chloroflexi bacterium]|nr:phosphatase PAP2 family protein [Chloroflexota bacterium]MBP7043060.1 phosphatase PAP2 family protein [Chloroflexota bacterium]
MNFTALLDRDKAWSQRLADRVAGRFSHKLAWLLARSGDSWLWALIIIWLVWRWQPVGWVLLWVVVVTAVIVAISKGIFQRRRPSGPGRALSTDKYSFPSGHAARAAAVALTLSFALPIWTPVWLVWATAVSLARVALSRHYLSDICAGWLVGLPTALLINLL